MSKPHPPGSQRPSGLRHDSPESQRPSGLRLDTPESQRPSGLRLNHIGIAVQDLPQLRGLFELLGTKVERSEPVPEQGVVTHFLPFQVEAQGSHLEFLEVSDPEGTVAKFIAKRGPGIHHLSFRVDRGELDPLCARMRAAGVRLIYDAPKAGAHSMRINFIHPLSAGGMLIEVMEPSS